MVIVVVVVAAAVVVWDGVVLAHQLAVAESGGAQLRIQRHASHGAVQQRDPNIQNPLRATRGAADLQSHEPHAQLRVRVAAVVVEAGAGRGRDQVADEDSDGAHVDVPEPVEGVDLDHDRRRVGVQELLVDAEDELVVPRGVGVAVRVHTGRQLPVRVHPRHRVRPHGSGHRPQVLGRDHVQFQQLEGR